MPYNILNHAARAFHGGDFPLTRDLEERRRIEQLRLIEQVQPYSKTFKEYILDSYPRFPLTTHTERLISIGQRVADGILRRLMVELPPRHYKSTIFTRFLPGYCLRRYPDKSGGICCSDQDLATGFSENARDFFAASGGMLRSSLKNKEEWGTAEGVGTIWTAGVGKGTGKPGHFLFIDDPIKNQITAESAAFRRQVHGWWESVLSAREEPGSSVVIVHTRWHDNDLIGYLLSKNVELEKEGLIDECVRWHVISMPIKAIPEEKIKTLPNTVTRELDGRQPGEALDPTRFDERFIRIKEANTSPKVWDSVYQQNPTNSQGTIFADGDFMYFVLPGEVALKGDIELPKHGIRRIVSVDATFKDSPNSDMVGIGMWLQLQDKMLRLGQVNRRMGFNETLNTLRNLQPAWQFNELLIEDKANGTAIIETLRQEARGYIVKACDPMGGKTARAEAASVQFKQKRVYIPRYASWRKDYENQLKAFPDGTYDDLVDETSQVLNYVAGTGPIRVSTVIPGRGA
jgi:predicted phage terminase large subunit-like protein